MPVIQMENAAENEEADLWKKLRGWERDNSSVYET